MGITAVGMTTAREISVSSGNPDPRRALGLIVAAFGAGQMIGPIFGGYIAETTGSYTLPSLIAAGILVVAAALAITVRVQKSAS